MVSSKYVVDMYKEEFFQPSEMTSKFRISKGEQEWTTGVKRLLSLNVKLYK